MSVQLRRVSIEVITMASLQISSCVPTQFQGNLFPHSPYYAEHLISTDLFWRSTRRRISLSLSSNCWPLKSETKLLQVYTRGNPKQRSLSVAVRCEQSSRGNTGVDIWLGRVAMLGFVAAVAIEITTGKGLLQNIGLTTPLPTVALALTLAVGAWIVYSIIRSTSES
eukprot:TRINITY_DN1906_c0_g1_i1.p1 TRINITY_DN1906_c0_g1~~TRINITY_DN1906_c0_g1_i1.p1  ORF type:complete len:167 (+),score=12.91 TRINITY_DN1906_c0_g1_i1:293-793(+)